ncbi:hypothetical protein [Pelagibius sp. Alg239-R121]|uniref:hypothetical protein n=1 Tax=Pelagibius sp. Alg239-R121 TaxID=2993448 RepID=UPI0024A76AFF|nr:hypothetical protein [Pelagibius sp. Alg239-R121]
MRKLIAILSFGLALLAAGSAQAYVGPGLGLGAVGAILGVVLSIVLALFAIFWYPLKRLFKKKPQPRKTEKEA